jgi:hypothetical protein
MKRYGKPKGARRDYWRRISHSLAVFREAAGEDLHTIITNQTVSHRNVQELRIEVREFQREQRTKHTAVMSELARLTRSDGVFG